MKLMTTVDIPKGISIDYDDKIMLLGSCFTDNVGEQLRRRLFDVCVNPFGTLYNPLSIDRAIDILLNKDRYSADDLFENRGTWHSFDHHSRFSGVDINRTLTGINDSLLAAKEALRSTTVMIITFGTAYVYYSGSRVVANCHKLPQSNFRRILINYEETVRRWHQTIATLRSRFPDLRFIFTVSPIRHLSDGLAGNSLSKSTLRLVCNELAETVDGCEYFPSYEILLDELRDYRFYAADMLHPSDQAVEYVYERFAETHLSEPTLRRSEECLKLWRLRNHRPMTDNADDIARLNNAIVELEKKLSQR